VSQTAAETVEELHPVCEASFRTYCRLNKGRVHFVVVFNLTRLVRDKCDHFALRSHLQSPGISLPSATKPIDDMSTGKLMTASGPCSRSSTRVRRGQVIESVAVRTRSLNPT
jgi:hypothetical protein